MDEELDNMSGSDFDDDEDPDKIEVPGGGKDLAAAASIQENRESKLKLEDMLKNEAKPPPMSMGGNSKMGANMAMPPYEMMRNQMEMAALGMNSPYMQNPFLQNLSALLYSNQAGAPPWGAQLSNKAVASMWNSGAKPMHHQEEEEVDDEELGVAETYSDYMPSKLKLGKKHPDPVVETASLSSVAPADVWYKLSIPDDTIRSGALSALQLESITYTSQAHEHILPDGSRAGFLIGDGAGVGKGRTIAGVIFENYLKGRKRAIWVSVSNDLKYDAERDLRDIGAGRIEVHPLNKFKYAKISSAVNGNIKKGVIFSTYSALIGESNSAGGKYKSRLKQLLQWCGQDFDGLIIFDECHRAKNLCPVGSSKPTKTGLTVLELQNKLPKARVVYASATGASEPRNMAYMVRLGMWGPGTPFKEFADFISAVEKRGVGAMEIVAMDMKLRGMYIARQLSFHGVAFKIEEVPLSKDFEKTYDASVKLWVEAMQKFHEAAELVDAENRMRKTMWGQFWSAHQRFFKYLCIAAKVPHAVAVAHEAIKCGKCVVIGLQSTGEARTLEQLERDDGELTDFVSTAKGVFQTLVEKHFPAPDRNRIQRLLGLDPPISGSKKATNGNDEGSSSGKRKMRQAAVRAVKRNKWSTSDSDNDSTKSSDSEYHMSNVESEVSEEHSDSNASSDFNPFNSDSDSDNDPWSRNKKKGKKQKKSPKKRPSTQDKLSMLLTQKTNKAKVNGGMSNDTKPAAPPMDAIERACQMKEEILYKIERLGERLPPNTLDQLIDELGGPENVAEMTGRKGRVVQTEDGGIQYESRSEVDVPLETLNLTEKQRFMDGEKDVAIISEAASSGISLQSDRRVKNQRRRVHITLELPWSADRAIQQFGRTHRSNQVNAPEYIFLISDLAGERRFASIVAKRLESLGALTHGDRRATETRDLSQFNIDNKYGRAALESTMKAIMGYENPIVPPPRDYKGDFFKDVAAALVGVGLIVNSENMPGVLSLDKDYNNMSKFLNRILGMPVELQNRLFRYFTDTLEAIITQAKRSGRFDLGILDLGAGGEMVKRVRTVTFLRKHATGTAPTELHTVHVERGMSWPEALEKLSELTGEDEGFYLSHQIRNGKHTAILAVAVSKKSKNESKKEQMFSVYRPNTGLQFRQESLAELEKKYKKVESADAEEAWTQQYDSSVNTCSHAYWRGNCRNVNMGHDCEVGLRRRTYNVVAGSVLSVWSRVEGVLASKNGTHNNKMQVIRLRTKDDLKVVGTLIPKNCVDALIEALSADAEKTEEVTFD
ncbi:protein strawberry notch isoform X3 [Tribolium castaneum]|uniref:Protein strawberry notch-like protein n=1 Tax=Tribolium castaneum TaxID=7070 RepID=A0A139WGU1_TRICA|nr:PREDICTED: protein strawberry notch isoform X3 [Tribolium castaneum]KYB27027.1 Protein strawberry notch-like protein [Tribolium castaneum]|eukprot:XP_015836323.1 PREDICTED: protein strawberry notch isoform X3 [Tribolium castaneum]